MLSFCLVPIQLAAWPASIQLRASPGKIIYCWLEVSAVCWLQVSTVQPLISNWWLVADAVTRSAPKQWLSRGARSGLGESLKQARHRGAAIQLGARHSSGRSTTVGAPVATWQLYLFQYEARKITLETFGHAILPSGQKYLWVLSRNYTFSNDAATYRYWAPQKRDKTWHS